MNITLGGKVTNSYSYIMAGQMATANISGKHIWDGLALLKRGTTQFVNEPAVTGGNPILANGKTLFNDMLGSSLGTADKSGNFSPIKRTAFGEELENKAGSNYNMFTGKPQIAGLGYAFLLRNYRGGLGKWQTSDPLGYPDGWNNLAYVNNHIVQAIDLLGAKETIVVLTQDFDSGDIYFYATNYWLDYETKNSETDVVIISYESSDSMSSVNQKLKNYCSNNKTSISKLHIADH